MTIKESAEKWVRSGPQAVGVAAAVALVIGALVGLGAGYKIEQSRTRSDVKRLQAQIKAGGGGTTSGKLGQRVGHVTDVSAGVVTVSTAKAGVQHVHTTSTTTYFKAAKGTIADVVVGHRILSTVGSHDIIVLDANSALGRPVKSVGKDFFVLDSANGAPSSRIETKDVKVVDTVGAAKATDVAKGASVLVGGHAGGKGVFNAVELILLPTGSAFVH